MAKKVCVKSHTRKDGSKVKGYCYNRQVEKETAKSLPRAGTSRPRFSARALVNKASLPKSTGSSKIKALTSKKNKKKHDPMSDLRKYYKRYGLTIEEAEQVPHDGYGRPIVR